MKTITLFRKLIWIFILSGFYCQAYAQEPEIILSESFDKANGYIYLCCVIFYI